MPDGESTLGPFATGKHDGHEVGHVDAQSRIALVRGFDRKQCLAALQLKHLQSTVRAAVARRIRQIERETLQEQQQ